MPTPILVVDNASVNQGWDRRDRRKLGFHRVAAAPLRDRRLPPQQIDLVQLDSASEER